MIVPSETITYNFKDSDKNLFEIENFLKKLQSKSKGIIKSFDVS